MEVKEKKKLEVTVDKRHIVSIGERLYAESVELLRELVNNAHDADATESFQVEDVERKLIESVPLKAPDFAVHVNGRRLYPRSLVGRRIPLLEGTKYGPVTGEICADFLPVTSDRSSFIVDSGEYQEFLKIMDKVVGIVGKALGREADRSEQRKASRAVNEALQRVHRALARNPELSPFGPIEYGEPEEPGEAGGGAVIAGRGKGKGEGPADSEVRPAQSKYIARLVTQEISLMKETRSPRLAFTRQSRLLKDAFSEEE